MKKEKDMIMIWRAIMVTAVALAIFALVWVIYQPVQREKVVSKDLGDIVFVTNDKGDIYKIR